jgi:hypothetical protein
MADTYYRFARETWHSGGNRSIGKSNRVFPQTIHQEVMQDIIRKIASEAPDKFWAYLKATGQEYIAFFAGPEVMSLAMGGTPIRSVDVYSYEEGEPSQRSQRPQRRPKKDKTLSPTDIDELTQELAEMDAPRPASYADAAKAPQKASDDEIREIFTSSPILEEEDSIRQMSDSGLWADDE